MARFATALGGSRHQAIYFRADSRDHRERDDLPRWPDSGRRNRGLGKGFEVDRVGSLPWLRGAVGFASLDRLRAWLPQTRSFLMDRETLLDHRERWGHEGSPTSARLTRLDHSEADLYEDLVGDRLGEAVRLEQERVDWIWARDRLPYAPMRVGPS